MMILYRWKPPNLINVKTDAVIIVIHIPTVINLDITFIVTEQVGIAFILIINTTNINVCIKSIIYGLT